MWANLTRSRGFTIVELLIVIVVIAVLVAIIVVAFNGIQTRSKNSSIVSTVQTYIKALKLYKVDNGSFPNTTSCLGVGYSGGVCRNDGAGWAENGTNFNTVLLSPYMVNPPRPHLTTVDYNGTLTITGAFYTYANASYNATGGGIGIIHLGTGACPGIGGLSLTSSTAAVDGQGVLCRYAMAD